ncbi:hypothetical protein OFN24_26310, partial [Escherichia coli]|nr:hypothetical protein [Escherichia coli]
MSLRMRIKRLMNSISSALWLLGPDFMSMILLIVPSDIQPTDEAFGASWPVCSVANVLGLRHVLRGS